MGVLWHLQPQMRLSGFGMSLETQQQQEKLRQRHIVNRLQNSTVSGKNELSYAKQVGFFRPIIGGSVTYNDQPYSKFLKSR